MLVDVCNTDYVNIDEQKSLVGSRAAMMFPEHSRSAHAKPTKRVDYTKLFRNGTV
jgi:hypothetical protein